MLQCHLVVRGIYAELAEAAPRLPGLETLLARGRRHGITEGGAEARLCAAFGLAPEHGSPIAPCTALADGLAADDGRYWLRGDPVHLALLRDSLALTGPVHDLEPDEAEALLATLNRHFAADGIEFLAPVPSRWYIALAQPARLQTRELPAALGGDVDRLLPQGEDARQWHRWINEAQMLLHDHPVNLAREEHGRSAVNSIWPWGGGILPHIGPSPFAAVWAGDPCTRGLALAAGSEAQPLPKQCQAWLEEAAAGAHLLVLDALETALYSGSAASGNDESWFAALQALERDWFMPLLQGLDAGRIESVQLHLCDRAHAATCSVTRNDRWKFWRRRHPLKRLIHD